MIPLLGDTEAVRLAPLGASEARFSLEDHPHTASSCNREQERG